MRKNDKLHRLIASDALGQPQMTVAKRLTMLGPRVGTAAQRLGSPDTIREQRRLGQHEWERIRRRILLRDKGLCQCVQCRDAGRTTLATEVDHIVPLWQGGSDDESNLQAINHECHKRKSAIEAAQRYRGD